MRSLASLLLANYILMFMIPLE